MQTTQTTQIGKLDHVNVRTTQLDTMIEWYTSVLGLRSGERPDFPFPGAWMYAGDSAVVHLVGISGDPATGSETPLKLEHFALSATGCAGFLEKLDADKPSAVTRRTTRSALRRSYTCRSACRSAGKAD